MPLFTLTIFDQNEVTFYSKPNHTCALFKELQSEMPVKTTNYDI